MPTFDQGTRSEAIEAIASIYEGGDIAIYAADDTLLGQTDVPDGIFGAADGDVVDIDDPLSGTIVASGDASYYEATTVGGNVTTGGVSDDGSTPMTVDDIEFVENGTFTINSFEQELQ